MPSLQLWQGPSRWRSMAPTCFHEARQLDKASSVPSPQRWQRPSRRRWTALPAEYYQVEHDSVAGELALLPPHVHRGRPGLRGGGALWRARGARFELPGTAAAFTQRRVSPALWLCQPGTGQMELQSMCLACGVSIPTPATPSVPAPASLVACRPSRRQWCMHQLSPPVVARRSAKKSH